MSTLLRRKRQEELGLLIAKAARLGDSELIAQLGAELRESDLDGDVASLTILTNDTGHMVPKKLIVGDFFVASRGTFDTSSAASLKRKYISILKSTHKKLVAKRYTKVFLIPMGPTTLNMQIKALVRDVLHLQTVDYAYFDGRYMPVALSFRRDVYPRTK